MEAGWALDWDARTLSARRDELYEARLSHLRAEMIARDVPVLLLRDPNNIFYATGARNMMIFGMRSPSRYLVLFAEGPVILYDFRGSEHLATSLPTITEIRTAEGLHLLSSGGQPEAACARFAAAIRADLAATDPSLDRVAIDSFPWRAVDALRADGMTITDADEVLLPVRTVKHPLEIPYLREAMRRVDAGVHALEENTDPGLSEAEVWAHFHFQLMAKEGQYASTRLFQSGPNTYPYFQECGGRLLEKGDLLCLDTDAVGYEGYCVDYSRTFLAGDDKATDDQRLLYGRAREQLEHNAALLRPHMEYRELAEKAWRVPEEHQKSRYYCIGHGLGMAGEWPNIPHWEDDGDYPLDGRLEPGMVICLESYIGWDRSAEGVKLEDQFLVHEDRVERMSAYHFDERLG